MKVIYAKPIIEKISDAVFTAYVNAKTIEKIILNATEWCQLSREVDSDVRFRLELPMFTRNEVMIYGVRVVKEGTE